MTKRSPTARPTAERIPREPVGPLATTVIEELSTWLAGLGYSPGSAIGIVNLAKRLSVWMRDAGANVGDIDEGLLARFDRAERARDIVCTTVTQASGTFRRFLADAGYLVRISASATGPAQSEIASWRSWMLSYLGLVEKSADAHCRYASGLIEVITDDSSVLWRRLDTGVINAFVADSGRPYSLATRADIVSAVRCLLRWALSTGRLDTDFSAGILRTARHRRCLPRGVSPEQVAALLGACDLATVVGVRDRALVILLNRLGLRAGEAARLTLDDIDWVHGCLRVTGKGREHILPLPEDVGTAVEAWLRVRPEALDRAVFECVNPIWPHCDALIWPHPRHV